MCLPDHTLLLRETGKRVDAHDKLNAMAAQGIAEHPRREQFRLSTQQKNQIIAKRLSGMPLTELAREYGINNATVWRICKTLQNAQSEAVIGWKEQIKTDAIKGLTAGLRCSADPYKRGNLSARALEGLGEFNVPGQAQVNVAIVNNTPAQWRQEMIGLDNVSQHDMSESLVVSNDPASKEEEHSELTALPVDRKEFP